MVKYRKFLDKALLCFLFFLVFCMAVFLGPSEIEEAQPRLPSVTGIFRNPDSGEFVSFSLEKAVTSREQRVGLMFRDSIPDGTGMIFPVRPESEMAMWLKNCPVPEDVIFVREGRVVAIERSVPKFSERLIRSPGVVSEVVEIRGGQAEKFGLKVGDLFVEKDH